MSAWTRKGPTNWKTKSHKSINLTACNEELKQILESLPVLNIYLNCRTKGQEDTLVFKSFRSKCMGRKYCCFWTTGNILKSSLSLELIKHFIGIIQKSQCYLLAFPLNKWTWLQPCVLMVFPLYLSKEILLSWHLPTQLILPNAAMLIAKAGWIPQSASCPMVYPKI